VERNENQSWKGAEAITAGLYRMSPQEDPLLGGETGVQALHALKDPLRI
jgi:hypothetical protein